MKFNTLLIDGPYLGMVSHHAPYKLTTSAGLDSTLIHSFFRSLNMMKKKFTPNRIVVAWESYGTTSWRKEMCPEYKKGRKKMDDVYWECLDDMQAFLYLLGVEQFYSPHNEADDVIGRLVDDGTVIFTTDKDLMQLVGDGVAVWDGKVLFDIAEVKKKYLVKPKQIPDLLAIWGDGTDNIKGVDGYGKIKGAKIVGKYGDVESIPESEGIYEHRDRLLVNKKLTTLSRGCELKSMPDNVSDTIDSILDKYELVKIKGDVLDFLGRKGTLDKWL